jgi:hypothetical protein
MEVFSLFREWQFQGSSMTHDMPKIRFRLESCALRSMESSLCRKVHVVENVSFLFIVKQFQGSSMARDMLKLDAESIEFMLSRMESSLVRKFHVVENGRLSLS